MYITPCLAFCVETYELLTEGAYALLPCCPYLCSSDGGNNKHTSIIHKTTTKHIN